jgi:hypothetical protein
MKSAQRQAFGVRQLAAAFKRTLEKRAPRAVFKNGSEQPHISEGTLWARCCAQIHAALGETPAL